MLCYTYSVVCADCDAAWHVSHMMVVVPLRSQDGSVYVCRRCFLGVLLPQRVEARLLRGLSDDQTDGFGNPSPFRTWLARETKQYAAGSRPYALVTIPEIEIRCPRDGTILQIWRNYPEDPPLVCPKCGSCSCRATHTGEIGFDVVTVW